MGLKEIMWKRVGWIQQAHDKIPFGDELPVQNTAMNPFTLKKAGISLTSTTTVRF